MVDWNKIEQIITLSMEAPQCPICLFSPVAGKITKCGHVYCWACILHYLALSDKNWRKCPICFESIHINDLKRYFKIFKIYLIIALKINFIYFILVHYQNHIVYLILAILFHYN